MPNSQRRIGVSAPSSCFDRSKFSASVGFLESLGFSVIYSDAVFLRNGYLAGTDEERAADLIYVTELYDGISPNVIKLSTKLLNMIYFILP